MKEYDVIYADPPWRYDFSKSKSRKIENQYQTMSLEEIKNLKIPTKKNSVCYLWATSPKLLEALEVLKSWGFKYKTHAIWDKEIIGMGYWFRGQHELLLVGVKGKFSPPNPKDRISSIFKERRTKHSSKPSLIRDLIFNFFPDKEFLELFARTERYGWDSFGNEIPNSIDILRGRDD